MKDLEWRGDSVEAFRAFPSKVHAYLGAALRQVEHGRWPPCAKPLPDVGSGVCELRQRHRRVAYRVVFVARFDRVVYVLHCFVKDAAEGKRTRDREIQLVRRRYAELLAYLGLH
jgi:phage-related protein